MLDFGAFMGPVINSSAFDKITGYIDYAKTSDKLVTSVIAGGKCKIVLQEIRSSPFCVDDNSKGYFIHPTVIETKDFNFKTLTEEIFGPVITVFVYPDSDFEKTVRCFCCNTTNSDLAKNGEQERKLCSDRSNVLG